MPDFVRVNVITDRKGKIRIVPEFLIGKSKDLMVRGGAFLAVWDERKGLWSRDENDVKSIVDELVLNKVDEVSKSIGSSDNVQPVLLKNYSTKKWREWKQYVKDSPDNWHPLDANVLSADADIKKEDYATKTLPYVIAEGSTDAYDKLVKTLYNPSEREKFEWYFGALLCGASKKLQKFVVFYGAKGSGKSTIIDIGCGLLEGYWRPVTAKVLGMSNAAFPLEQFSDDPLLAVDHEAKLSNIDDNTRLNSIVAHNSMMVNEKFKKPYPKVFKTSLMFGSNDPVKITDLKSGLLRRMIDINPSNRLLDPDEYFDLVEKVKFEYGAIAYHCIQVYKKLGFNYYNGYVPSNMVNETNEFYNFVIDELEFFEQNSDMLILKTAYGRYKAYCEDANIRYPYSRTAFKNELKNYFETYIEKTNGFSNVFRGFKDPTIRVKPKADPKTVCGDSGWIKLDCTKSLLDDILNDCPAQGCKDDGSPRYRWVNVKTKLSDIDTSKLHWVKPMSRLICIDFDILGDDGEKSLEKNLEAANKWPKTYVELSKSGKAIHLYYWYDGDVTKLQSLYAPYIEIKVFTGNSSLRRLVTKCNDIDIATISSNLPLKGDTMVKWEEGTKDERHLLNKIGLALRKKVHADTTSNVHYIKAVLDDAYASGMPYYIPYDVRDDIERFAASSTHQSQHCLELVGQMHFQSESIGEPIKDTDEDILKRLVFFDIEVGRPDKKTNNPGVFLIVWKVYHNKTMNVMLNPKAHEVEFFVKNYPIAGFNNLSYDNPMLHGAMIGNNNQQQYELSKAIIIDHERPFPQAANYSYIDVFDMCTEKMGLKKWEIKLGLPHKEMNIPWNEPIPVDRWDDLVSYCKNDVLATEAVFDARQGDYMARKIQVALVGLLHPDEDIKVCVNDTTNTLSKRIIFGNNRNPQSEFNYRDLSKPVGSDQYEEYRIKFGADYRFRVFDADGLPLYRDYDPGEVLPEGWSILPFFPGYTYAYNEKKKKMVSTYLGEEVGEGGRNFSRVGYWEWVWDGDVNSMHPSSYGMHGEVLFGPKYTKIVTEIVEARVAIKHRDFETAGSLLGGALKPYLSEELAGDLAQALKIVINSIYGLTSAKFPNEFRDPRNVDNIVAKRGALFMTLLKREVENRGAIVCHIKTDSIKIPNASEEVKDFVIKFGREYGYEFETEDIFTKFALFNDSAYLGYTDFGEWVTKADQFKKEKQPFLFKTLFTHEPYAFNDFCETKSATDGALYLDMNENLGEPLDDYYDKLAKKLERVKKKNEEDPSIPAIIEELKRVEIDIPSHHKYTFIGRVGQFTPVLPGKGGGILYRRGSDGNYAAASGSKGYRWLESEDIRDYFKDAGIDAMMQTIDISYYQKKVDAVRDLIDRTVRQSTNDELGVDYFVSDQVPEKHELEGFDSSQKGDLPWTA